MSTPPAPKGDAQILSFSITDATIDGSGVVDLKITDIFGADKDLKNDIVIDGSSFSETLREIDLSKGGNRDNQEDVFRLNLSEFKSDFTINIKSEGPEDIFVIEDVISYTVTSGGTYRINYLDETGTEHTVTLNPGDAQVQLFGSTINDLTDGRDQGQTIGTAGDDMMYGGPGDGQADGGAQINDTMEGGNGNDTIFAGDGDDRVTGGLGDDTIMAGDGNDVVYGDGDIPDSIVEAQDVGSLLMSVGANRTDGSAVGNPADAGVGTSVIYDNAATLPDGSPVALRLTVTDMSDDTIGVNLINSTSLQTILLTGGSSLRGETVDLKIEFLDQDTLEPLVLNGNATFSDLDDNSYYGNGFEQLVLDPASFNAFGTSPDTSLLVSNEPGKVIARGTEPNDPTDQDAWFSAMFEGKTEINFQLIYPGQAAGFGFNGQEIENVVITPVEGGDDVIDGGAGEDTLYGEGGNDTISGGADDDTLSGGGGDDLLMGDEGDDLINAADDSSSSRDTVIGGEGSDRIMANGGDTVDGSEDADGKDVDVLVVNDVAQIDYVDDAGNWTSDVTEKGTVTFNDGTTMAFENIENFVVDGEEFTSSDTTPTLDLDFQGGTTPAGPGESGSDFVALDPATAPIIENDGKNFADDGIGETARYQNVAVVDGKSIDLIAVVEDTYQIDSSGDTGGTSNPDFNVTSPDGNTANIRFDGNAYYKVTWKVVEAGTDIPVNGNFSLLVNDLDGVSDFSRFERITVAKDQLDSYSLDGNTDIETSETADDITFIPATSDPGAPGALPENSVQLTFTNTSQFTIEYERLNTGGNVGLDGEFSSHFFTDPTLVDTNPDFENIFSEGGSPVTIAAATSRVDSEGADLKELSIKPVEGTFPDGAAETLTFSGDVDNVEVPLDGSDTDIKTLSAGGKDYSVQFNPVTGAIEVKPISVDEVADGDIKSILEGITYNNSSDLDGGVSPDIRTLEVTVTDIYGTESAPATATIRVVGFEETTQICDVLVLNLPDNGDPSSGSFPANGDVLSVGGQELVELIDAGHITHLSAGGSDTTIETGDTITLNGVAYTIDDVQEVIATVSHDDPSGQPTVTPDVTIQNLTLINPDDGSYMTIAMPVDGVNLPNITEIEITTVVSQGGSFDDEDVNEDDDISLGDVDGVPIYDAIQLSGSAPALGDTQSTSAGDLVAVDEPLLVVEQDEEGVLKQGDTVQIGADVYSVGPISCTTATVSHDDEFGIETTTSGVEMNVLTLSPVAGGAALTYLVPTDNQGDLPEITEITVDTAYVSMPSVDLDDPSDNDIGSDEIVTLDNDQDLTPVFDLIAVDGFNPLSSGTLATDSGDATNGTLTGVADNVAFDLLGDPSQLSLSDTANINGVEYMVTGIYSDLTGDITHDDPATGAQVTSTDVPLIGIRLTDFDGNTLDFVTPVDAEGDFPQITQITYDASGVTSTASVDIDLLDSNDIVTLETDEADPIYDAIKMAPGLPTEGDLYASGSGDLTSVEEPIHINLSPEGQIEPGATFVFDGNTYEVTTTKQVALEVTFDNGATTLSDVPGYIIEGANSDGETVTFTLPQDGTDLPDITQIVFTSVSTPDDVEVHLGEVDSDDHVSLGAPGTQIFDAIQLSALTAPTVGEVLTTEGGLGVGGETPSDLVTVDEPISFLTQDDPTLITPGTDTVAWNGSEHTVISARTIEGTYTTDAGVQTDISGNLIELQDVDTGETTQFILPNDDEGPLPGIEQIEVTAISAPLTSVPLDDVDADDDVTLDTLDGAGPTGVVLYDFVQIDGQPTEGETKSVLDNDLLEVDEPIVFTTADPEKIEVGDTTVIDGVGYTVTDTGQWEGIVTLDNGETPTVTGGLLTLDDGAGGLLHYATPYDAFGDLPDITQISFDKLDDDAAPAIEQENVDSNDFVTLICFAGGTHILTNKGEVKVEDLKLGDKVLTRDSGYQQIKWIGCTTVSGRGRFAPVTIRQGTFGNERDLSVSPQHRILVCDWRAELMFGEFEVLVPAKHLTNTDGIYTDPRDEVSYYHILFERHEVIFSEGIPTESFHPGDYSVTGLADETRDELFELFPELADAKFDYGPSARMSLKRREAIQLVAELELGADKAAMHH